MHPLVIQLARSVAVERNALNQLEDLTQEGELALLRHTPLVDQSRTPLEQRAYLKIRIRGDLEDYLTRQWRCRVIPHAVGITVAEPQNVVRRGRPIEVTPERQVDERRVRKVVIAMPAPDGDVLRLRLEGKTQQQTGKILSFEQYQVSRIERRAVRTIRERLAAA